MSLDDRSVMARVLANRSVRFGLVIVGTIGALALLAPWLAPHGFEEQHPDALLQAPSSTWWLGTDRLGRDVASRLLFGARISMTVALATSAVAMVLGTVWGALSGWLGGRVDELMMRVVDALYSFPDLLLVVFVATWLGQSMLGIILSLSVVSWVTVARLVRGEVHVLRERAFVEAARALGLPPWRVVARHIMPMVVGPLLVTLTFRIPAVILAESTLSFIGLGLQAPFSSWGVMAAEGWEAMAFHPHLIGAPSMAMCLTIFGFHLLGEGLRRSLAVQIDL
jgi:oligopeptide transport system permease protein